MSLYHPTQGLRWVFDKKTNTLFIASTIQVPLDANETIQIFSTPLDGFKADIFLFVKPEAFIREGYHYEAQVLIASNINIKLDNETSGDGIKKCVADAIDQQRFEITATVFKQGDDEGKKVTNVISEDSNIEID